MKIGDFETDLNDSTAWILDISYITPLKPRRSGYYSTAFCRGLLIAFYFSVCFLYCIYSEKHHFLISRVSQLDPEMHRYLRTIPDILSLYLAEHGLGKHIIIDIFWYRQGDCASGLQKIK